MNHPKTGEPVRLTPRIVSLAVLLVLIAALGSTFFQVMAPFLLPLFLAGMTAVICQPLFRYFLVRSGNRVSVAAGLTTTTVMAAIMIPMLVATIIASLQLYTFAANVTSDSQWKEMITDLTDRVGVRTTTIFSEAVEFGNGFLPADRRRDPEVIARDLQFRVKKALVELGDRSLGIAAGNTFGVLSASVGMVVSVLIAMFMYAIALFYFFADGTELIASAEKLIPVHAEYQRELLREFAKAVRAVVVATFLAAIAQGLATTLALWFFGFSHLFVLFAICTLGALIPIAGTWLVWIPCAVVLFAEGHWGQALALSIYGAAFVGFLDNVIRAWVLNTDTKLHPLLAFISVLGGIQAMGLWGVFIGPIVASCLHALVKIFNHELFQLSRDRQLALSTSEPSAAGPSATEPAVTAMPGAKPPAKATSRSTSKRQAKRRK